MKNMKSDYIPFGATSEMVKGAIEINALTDGLGKKFSRGISFW